MRAILLVPSEATSFATRPPVAFRDALLADGVAGARVPTMARAERLTDDGSWVDTGWCPYDPSVEAYFPPARAYRGDAEALVLALDGRPVAEGVFRAWWFADEFPEADNSAEALQEALDMDPSRLAREVASWRRDGQPLGTVVVVLP
jgi:hypothetical protein